MKTIDDYIESDEMMLVHKGTFFFLLDTVSKLMLFVGDKSPADMANDILAILKRSNVPKSIYMEYGDYMRASVDKTLNSMEEDENE